MNLEDIQSHQAGVVSLAQVKQDSSLVKQVQHQLNQLGCMVGSEDGIWGTKTDQAWSIACAAFKMPRDPLGPSMASFLLTARVLPGETSASAVPLLGLQLIKQFERYAEEQPDGRAKAYPDPIYGWDIPTIGYGTTQYPDGSPVQQGDIITPAQAEQYLTASLETKCQPFLEKIQTWGKMNANQRGALYSFAYNLGPGFYGASNFQSITQVCDSPDRWNDHAWVEAQFVKYIDPGTPAEEGLRKRRVAEAALFCR